MLFLPPVHAVLELKNARVSMFFLLIFSMLFFLIFSVQGKIRKPSVGVSWESNFSNMSDPFIQITNLWQVQSHNIYIHRILYYRYFAGFCQFYKFYFVRFIIFFVCLLSFILLIVSVLQNNSLGVHFG